MPKHGDGLFDVIVYGYSSPAAYGRRMVLPKMSMKELNQKPCIISRVVIHPKYRTTSFGAKLVKDTLPLARAEFVAPAVKAHYKPFAERAGMKEIIEQTPPREASKMVNILRE